MAFRFILTVLPALALAAIDILVTGKYKELDIKDTHLYFSGQDVGIITNTERNTFKLTDYNLKNLVRSRSGKSPDDAFLRSPTPWGDLYKKYGWTQVTRTLIPRQGRIINTTSESVMFQQMILANNGDKQATFSVSLSRKTKNRVRTSWDKLGELSVTEKIYYEIQLEGRGPGRHISSVYSSSWGKSTDHVLKMVEIGSKSPLEIVLETGQYVSTQLNTTKVSLVFDIEYEAFLSGEIASNYAEAYKGHHFSVNDLEICMTKGNLSNQVMSHEVNKIVFYPESTLIVQDYYDNILVNVRLPKI